MVLVSKNRVVMSKICSIIPITCFLFFDGFWPFSPSRQLGHLDVVHSKLSTLIMLKVALGLLWDAICSTCQKAFEAGDDAAVPPCVFYVCLLLFRNNRKTSFLEEKTAATGLVPISSRRTPSIKSAVRKKHHGEWWTVFFGKVEGTLADVERI